MPMYLYRREDGSTFEYKQKFSDDPLKIDPETGQGVVRVVQPTGVIFKGSGFYINDSKGASKQSLNGGHSSNNGNGASGDTKSESTSTESASDSKDTKESKTTESKTETKAEKKTESPKVAS